MTQAEFLKSKRTLLDHILFISWIPLVLSLLFAGIDLMWLSFESDGMFDRYAVSTLRPYVLFFGVWAPVVVCLRTWYNYRTKKFLDQYDELYG